MKCLALAAIFCLPIPCCFRPAIGAGDQVSSPDRFFQAAARPVFRGGRRGGSQFKGTCLCFFSWKLTTGPAYERGGGPVAGI